MMRVATFAAVTGALPLTAARTLVGSSREQCVPLMNRGAYFGVEVAVGSPEQKFELVADTGSNNLLVASCVCHSSGGCQGAEHCFRGTNRSSTFSIDADAADKALAITYGSGTIEAVTASDSVRVGPLSTTMHNSLLLMVSDAQLNIDGTFEGILGLGVPGPTEEEDAPTRAGSPSVPWKGFLDEANVTSFSMCFSEGTEGSMELGAAVPDALQAIGRYHWGVGLSGISVGGGDQDGSATLSFCQKDDPNAGDDTPCGLIPDSGTTLMMGPEEHVAALYASICDQWTYCSTKFDQVLQGAAAGGGDEDEDEAPVIQDLGSGAIFSEFPAPGHGGKEAYTQEELTQAKALTLMAVLESCEDWLGDAESEFNGMPSIHMKITDLAGKEQDIELTPWSYVMVSEANVTDFLSKPKAKGIDGFPAFPSLLQKVVQRKARPVKVCQPAFDTMEYQTRNNGAVWILGSPLFFQYKVGYDLTGPSMSFTKLDSEDSCRSCTSQESMMLRGKISRPVHRRPRGLKGPIRRPRIDTTRPL